MSINHPLQAVTALDGRYANKLTQLAPIVSEFGLLKNRVRVECAWLLHLSDAQEIAELRAFSVAEQLHVAAIVTQFDLVSAERIKAIEAQTNHDVKAVEYFVKEELSKLSSLDDVHEWVHFACTSEDINNTAYALMISELLNDVVLSEQGKLIEHLDALAAEHANLAMLSRTHGQAASPTTLGKEMKNVAARLRRQYATSAQCVPLAKFNGAVGNYNAHVTAYPDVDWPALTRRFLESLGLTQNQWTTQIEPHDYLAELFHSMVRFNQILLDFNRDIWSYISIEYFSQKRVETETGSSTMPHKINPIDFENSEGNLGLANAQFEHLASKLLVSRWQRDLSDSTVLRSLGSAFGYASIAYQATLKGLSRLEVNAPRISDDLASCWEVLAEPVQTVMRKYGLSEPYERLKEATRGNRLDAQRYQDLLDSLQLPEAADQALRSLTPQTYTGIAAELACKPLE